MGNQSGIFELGKVYYLFEEVASTGYLKLDGPLRKISENDNGEISVTLSNGLTPIESQDMMRTVNERLIHLPSMGSSGRLLSQLIGGILFSTYTGYFIKKHNINN